MAPSLAILTHFYNEEVLLPHWIDQHKDLADECIMVNHGSTDSSLEIIKALAPSHWKVVDTKLTDFDAAANDQEIMEWEKTLKTDFKFTINLTEFIFCKDLKQIMEEYKDKDAIGFKAYMMVDKDLNLPLDEPLWKSRTHGYLDNGSAVNSRRGRYMHTHPCGNYNTGRHSTTFSNTVAQDDWNILFASFSPWPQAQARKLQIQTKMVPEKSFHLAQGVQHAQTKESLEVFYQQELAKSSDLMLDTNFKLQYDAYMEKHS